MTVKELIAELRSGYGQDETIAASIWNATDVLEAAEQNDLGDLTHEECDSVLDWVEAHHDAQYGINWDALALGIEEAVIINKKENK